MVTFGKRSIFKIPPGADQAACGQIQNLWSFLKERARFSSFQPRRFFMMCVSGIGNRLVFASSSRMIPKM